MDAVKIRSPVELTLLPAFRKCHYSALYQAVDITPHPRPYARCLQDRGYVYSPQVPNKPVTIGHRYSLLAYLPGLVSVRRVGTGQDPEALGCQQVRKLLRVHPAPAGDILTLGDSRYSKPCEVRTPKGELVYSRPLWLALCGFGLFSALACKEPCWCSTSSLGEVSSPMAKWKVFAFVPGLIQRDFGRIIWQIGTPAHRLKPRGKPLGGLVCHPGNGILWSGKAADSSIVWNPACRRNRIILSKVQYRRASEIIGTL